MAFVHRATNDEIHEKPEQTPEHSERASAELSEDGWRELEAYLAAARKPRSAVLREAIEAIVRVHREGIIDDDDLGTLFSVLLEATVRERVDDVVRSHLPTQGLPIALQHHRSRESLMRQLVHHRRRLVTR